MQVFVCSWFFLLDALKEIILNYTVCTLEDWNKTAVTCAEKKV